MSKRKEPRLIDGTEHWQCTTCGQWTPRGEMGIRRKAWNGLDHHCNKCLSVRRKKQWRDRIEHNRELSRKSTNRFHKKNPEYSREYYRNNREEILAKCRLKHAENKDERRAMYSEYGKAHREERNEYRRRYNKENRKKHLARKRINSAVRRGTVVKPDCCERCGNEVPKDKLHGHHSDYNRPYDVEWFCSACHGAEHRVIPGEIHTSLYHPE